MNAATTKFVARISSSRQGFQVAGFKLRLGDQIQSLDKSRLRSRIEMLSQDEMAAVDEAVRITLGLWP
jgi:mRNA-degrading endonuclease toxin of MazEF toxin-antitoxin module